MSHRHPSHRSRVASLVQSASAVPEIAVAILLIGLVRDRLTAEDPERGDVIQWVLVTAFGAIIAAAVGAVVYTKLKSKASSITLTTNP